MIDKYRTFDELAAGEERDVDYQVCLYDRSSPVVVLAPHGGRIEPGTSLIARAIAGDDHSIYCFEGLRRRPHSDLHVTSSRFDEPQALELVAAAEIAIAIHGRHDRSPAGVWMGGLNTSLRDSVAAALEVAGFEASTKGHPLPGTEIMNICNRCSTGAGVQLEIPMVLRGQLTRDQSKLLRFAEAVRRALANR